ncbi:hypothetical protein B0H34DRAFT_625771, partial [Crassisporium funariophilum]
DEFFKVPKLLADGGNWVTYRNQLRWALTARGLLKHIDNVTSKPVDPNTGISTPSPSDATTYNTRLAMDIAYEARAQKYEMAEATVKQSIASSVPDSIFNRIKTKKTAKDVWDAITEIFESCSTMVAIDL